jgi:hypothetical protein
MQVDESSSFHSSQTFRAPLHQAHRPFSIAPPIRKAIFLLMRLLSLITFLAFIFPTQASLNVSVTSEGKTATKQVALPTLYVAQGESPAAGLPAGAFVATYTGTLNIPKRYRVYFSVESEGKIDLKVNDEEVTFTDGKSDRLRLNPGEVPIEITFTSPNSGAGYFRLYWEERREFAREPIPASAFTSSDKAPVDAAHLFASHNCIQCHQADLGTKAMPESDPAPTKHG